MIFNKDLIYRVTVGGQSEPKFCKVVNSMDTQLGIFLELAIYKSLGEGDPMFAAGITEFHYLKDVTLTLYDSDNEAK